MEFSHAGSPPTATVTADYFKFADWEPSLNFNSKLQLTLLTQSTTPIRRRTSSTRRLKNCCRREILPLMGFPVFFKEAADSTIASLTLTFNKPLLLGKSPALQKNATVRSVFKKSPQHHRLYTLQHRSQMRKNRIKQKTPNNKS